jgi:hypothetical protein
MNILVLYKVLTSIFGAVPVEVSASRRAKLTEDEQLNAVDSLLVNSTSSLSDQTILEKHIVTSKLKIDNNLVGNPILGPNISRREIIGT